MTRENIDSNSHSSLKMVLKSVRLGLVLNALGLGVYFAMEFWIMMPRPEEDAFNGIDVLHFWFTRELPLLVILLILNLLWLISVLREKMNPRLKRLKLIVCGVVALIWLGSLFPFGIATQVAEIIAIETKERMTHHSISQ
jgi:hypothetical protein